MTMLNRRETLALTAGAALMASSKYASAQTAPTPALRERIRVDHGWRFHLGHAADAERDFAFGRDQRSFAKAGLTSPATLANFDDSDWTPVTVPHDWVTDLPFAPPVGPPSNERADAKAAHGFKAIGRDYPQNS